MHGYPAAYKHRFPLSFFTSCLNISCPFLKSGARQNIFSTVYQETPPCSLVAGAAFGKFFLEKDLAILLISDLDLSSPIDLRSMIHHLHHINGLYWFHSGLKSWVAELLSVQTKHIYSTLGFLAEALANVISAINGVSMPEPWRWDQKNGGTMWGMHLTDRVFVQQGGSHWHMWMALWSIARIDEDLRPGFRVKQIFLRGNKIGV